MGGRISRGGGGEAWPAREGGKTWVSPVQAFAMVGALTVAGECCSQAHPQALADWQQSEGPLSVSGQAWLCVMVSVLGLA